MVETEMLSRETDQSMGQLEERETESLLVGRDFDKDFLGLYFPPRLTEARVSKTHWGVCFFLAYGEEK